MSEHKVWLFRPVDFTPETPVEWHDVSTIDDDWVVEMNIYGDSNLSSTWRHRRPSVSGLDSEWVYGRPPNGFYAKAEDGDG